jgi:hypothetical protein
MRAARRWIRQQRRGTERVGLVTSSSAQRLKPHASDIRVNIDPVHWFLSPAKDTRSSLYLEDAATEFQVQGLELDWTIVTWDADLRWSGDDWCYHSFRGAKWTDVKKPERRQYLKNAYRVLLTRARQDWCPAVCVWTSTCSSCVVDLQSSPRIMHIFGCSPRRDTPHLEE